MPRKAKRATKKRKTTKKGKPSFIQSMRGGGSVGLIPGLSQTRILAPSREVYRQPAPPPKTRVPKGARGPEGDGYLDRYGQGARKLLHGAIQVADFVRKDKGGVGGVIAQAELIQNLGNVPPDFDVKQWVGGVLSNPKVMDAIVSSPYGQAAVLGGSAISALTSTLGNKVVYDRGGNMVGFGDQQAYDRSSVAMEPGTGAPGQGAVFPTEHPSSSTYGSNSLVDYWSKPGPSVGPLQQAAAYLTGDSSWLIPTPNKI